MFWPDWPSSDVQVIVIKDSAAHIRKAEQYYSRQKSPSPQQLVHLMMAG
jgi:hypothetical protein